MKLITHGDSKYQDTTELVGRAHFSSLRIEIRRLRPGHHEPGVCRSNELIFVLAGQTYALQSANGLTHRRFIQPGVSCVCPVGTYEKASGNTSPIECLHIYLPPSLIEKSAITDYDLDPAKIELVYTGALNDAFFYRSAMAFRGLVREEIEATERLYLDGMQAALSAYLIQRYSIDRWVRPTRLPDSDRGHLDRAIDYIEAHFADNIGLAELASLVGLSEYHFARVFRQTIGVAPHRYVNFRRVQEAQIWLEKSRLPLSEIASITGFASQANFARVFNDLTGISPRTYRAARTE